MHHDERRATRQRDVLERGIYSAVTLAFLAMLLVIGVLMVMIAIPG
jgi:hypothetical protein